MPGLCIGTRQSQNGQSSIKAIAPAIKEYPFFAFSLFKFVKSFVTGIASGINKPTVCAPSFKLGYFIRKNENNQCTLPK